MIHFNFNNSKYYVRTDHGEHFLNKIVWFLRNSDSFLDVFEMRKKIEEPQK